MSDPQSRIANVIETTIGEDIIYFTLEGVMIGGFKGGVRIEPTQPEPKKERPSGSVVKPMTPHQVRRQRDKEAEALQTPEGRLKHLKDDVV